jgi:negative regulator of sigma E activity
MDPRNDKPLSDASFADASLAHELRSRLARKTPPADFTARVMERVERDAMSENPAPAAVRAFPKPRWVLAGALAASLAAVVFVAREGIFRASPSETEAETQLLLSLQLAGEKINKARDALLRPPRENAPWENER